MSVRTPALDETAVGAPSLPVHLDAWLWVVAVLAFGVGDVVTTTIGLSMGGVVETNPALVGIVGHGLPAMVAVKVGAFAVGAAGYAVVSKWTWFVPGVFALYGVLVVPWNLLVLSGVMA